MDAYGIFILSSPGLTSTTDEYGKMNSVMNPEEVTKNMEYEVDSGISSGYESSDSEGEKRELSEKSEVVVQECEDSNRDINKNLKVMKQL